MGDKRISEWAEELATAVDDAARLYSNEMELREHVHGVIVAAVDDLYGLGLTATGGEVNTKTTGTRSPLDRLYGGVAVEWEWDMGNARREHGAEQALTYLSNLREHHPGKDVFTAVVADGKQWGFLRVDPQDESTIDLFTEEAAYATSADHFMWRKNSEASCRQFLELIGTHRKSPITSKGLANRFGPDSDVASKLVTVFTQAMNGRNEKDRTDTLFREWRRALDVVYGDLDQVDGTLAEDVQAAYRSPTSRPLGEMLYVLHSYFALVSRVIAVELLAVAIGSQDDAPTTWRGYDDKELLKRLAGLEQGDLPGDLEISNLFEADLFSWWASQADGNPDMLTAIRDLLREVSDLAFPKIAFGPQNAGDVLRDLYQTLVPSSLRKALGEFLTPHWLAEASLARLTDLKAPIKTGRVLDPTCGTGTFIAPIIHDRLRHLARTTGDDVDAEEVQTVLDSVAGIDLNPVAVTAARVNFVLALGDFATVGPLTVPVWRSDSLLLPEPSYGQGKAVEGLAGIPHTVLTTSLDDPFVMPAGLVTTEQLRTLRAVIESSLTEIDTSSAPTNEDCDRAREAFRRDFAEEFAPGCPCELRESVFADDESVAGVLFDQILALALEGRDGIWARLIENAYAPVFAGQFDVVVGNPPWLTWTKLPEGWRKRSEPLWKRAGLWYTPVEEGESFSLQSGDIATLVCAVSLIRYAKPEGVVAFLTPKSLINGDPSGRAFRQFRLRPDERDRADSEATDVPFSVLWVDDWSEIKPFSPDAANTPIFLVTQRGQTQGPETPGELWRRGNGRMPRTTWLEARKHLVGSKGTFAPVDPARKTSSWRFQEANRPDLIAGGESEYTFGKGLDTRGANGVLWVDVKNPKPARGKKLATVRVTNRPGDGRKAVDALTGEVETALVYPLLRGRDVQPWVAAPESYMVLAHDPDDRSNVLETDTLRRTYPKAYHWLRRHLDVLLSRVVPPTRNWDMRRNGRDWCRVDGPLGHMAGEHLVVVRELAKRPAAAVVEARMDMDLGGRKVTPLIDHKLLFCSVNSRDEALYLAAMINSTPMQDLLESFVNQVSVSPKALSRLPIPKFDPDDENMQQLVASAGAILSAPVVGKDAEIVKQQPTIDNAVLANLAAGADYEPQPKPAKRRRTARKSSKSEPDAAQGTLNF